MRITFINVGYGDAILFEGSNGYTALLDGGGSLPEEFAQSAFRIRAATYFQKKNITHLHDIFISHIHEDHVCGLEAVLEQVTVDRIYVPYPVKPFLQGHMLKVGTDVPRSVPLYTAALNAYTRMLQRIVDTDCAVQMLQPGDIIDMGGQMTAHVLGPKQTAIQVYMQRIEQVFQSDDGQEVARILGELDATSNQTSFLIKFEMPEMALLAAADNCPREWDELPIDLFKNVTVLKLPHHGQGDAISEQIMQCMPLKAVVTTASSDRRYGSANPMVYERLAAMQPENPPQFLFTDERNYPPYFSQPDGFQAITLVVDSGNLHPEFIKL
ncbi:ComEC/Rec2 family competence protein [Agathobaculum desmolans]|uniref:ComEC/Rec2 family competence protein n=1 Tax=Agathobaculum desmolans TaxID=39484 RepID=UPI00248DE3A1|nr:MBL fold metallo-hydrolase [Agathobaculum desmolans]